MSTMHLSLLDALKAFVDEQVAGRGFGDGGEYLRELIRKDHDRQKLRRLLVDGAESASRHTADEAYFDELRARARRPV